MQAYVAKRDALDDANDETEQLQTAIKDMKGDMKALKEKASQLEASRRGCACKVSTSKTSQAGRCTSCGCARDGVKCSLKCGCGKDCDRPDKEKKEAIRMEKKIQSRMKKVMKRNGKGKGSDSATEDSDANDSDYADEEEERPSKNKSKAKKKARDESDDSDGSGQEGRPQARGKGKARIESESEEERPRARGKGKKRDESDDEARPAAAPRQNADRDPDDYDEAVDGLDQRLNMNDNME